MPGGSTGGVQAAGRFYRTASLSITNALTQIPFDTDSAAVLPFMVGRSGGDMQSLITGKAIARASFRATGLLGLSAVRMVLTRIRSGSADLVFADAYRTAPITGVFTADVTGMVDLDVDDIIRVECAAVGIALLSASVGGENATWADLVVG